MMTLEDLTRILHDGRHSLVVAHGQDVRVYDGRGVSDLYKLVKTGSGVLLGASVADKVVGKAAAALMMKGGVKEVVADVVSEQALSLVSGSDLRVECSRTAPHIINRAGTGWCPLEAKCKDCRDVDECLAKIDEFMDEMAKSRIQ